MMKIDFKKLIICIAIPVGLGALSGFLTSGSMDIFKTLNKPPFSPPAIVFPIVWTILFILMGISAAMIYNDKNAPENQKISALFTYALSLIFNFFWSIIFFNFRAFAFSFFWLLCLLFLIILTIIKTALNTPPVVI